MAFCRIKRKLAALFAVAAGLVPVAAFGYVSPGSPSGFVNDFAGVLSPAVSEILEQRLAAFKARESTEVVVVTVPSLEGEVIEEYAVRLFEEWGVGTSENDNGVLLLTAPREREVRIEVGYGLEGALTDLESSAIIRSAIVPAFAVGNYDGGVEQGVDAVLSAVSGEYSPGVERERIENRVDLFGYGFIIIFLLLGELVAAVVRGASKSHAIWPGGLVGGAAGAALGLFLGAAGVAAALGVLGIAAGLGLDYGFSRVPRISEWGKQLGTRRRHGGGWWGGGGGGGFGGFGGFGGGMSGGGGASGRW